MVSLFGSSTAHRELLESSSRIRNWTACGQNALRRFRPYAGVSTAILLSTKTNSGGTENVWFFDVHSDGFSLVAKRNSAQANDLPDVLRRWDLREALELERTRFEQSFCVPKADIVSQGYELSLNHDKAVKANAAPVDGVA
jgi:type I restriction enzyme M protein